MELKGRNLRRKLITPQTFLDLFIRHLLSAGGGGLLVQGLLAGDPINQVAGVVMWTGAITLSAKSKIDGCR